MEQTIPKKIHQIWSGVTEPLPQGFQELGETWKNNHPDWEYILWDNAKMIDFLTDNYPEFEEVYHGFKYNIQRWDAIRYLILYKLGGVYVDFDYLCIEPLDDVLGEHSCCFSSEPKEHAHSFHHGEVYFNNALMGAVPGDDFMKVIIDNVFDPVNHNREFPNKMLEVLETTGPLMISNLYQGYANKHKIYIIPEELVSPLTKNEVASYFLQENNERFNDYLEKKLERAVAVHYFLGGWV